MSNNADKSFKNKKKATKNSEVVSFDELIETYDEDYNPDEKLKVSLSDINQMDKEIAELEAEVAKAETSLHKYFKDNGWLVGVTGNYEDTRYYYIHPSIWEEWEAQKYPNPSAFPQWAIRNAS